MRFLALATVGLPLVFAQSSYPVCEDQYCRKCPVVLSSAGTGYPHCVYYHSSSITENEKFKHGTWWDLHPPFGHCVAVKSFQTTPDKECGATPIGCSGGGKCLKITLDKLQKFFAVERATNPTDCGFLGCAGGARSRRGLESNNDKSTGVLSNLLQYENGTYVMPAGVISRETGEDIMHQFLKEFGLKQPSNTPERKKRTAEPSSNEIQENKHCHWKVKDKEGYTKPSDKSQIITSGVVGPATISHTTETTVEFSSTVGAGLTFDIFSASVSFTTSKSHTSENTYTVKVPKGETGSIYFTPTLICADGMIQCDGDEKPHAASGCSGFLPGGKRGPNAGVFAFVSN